MIFFVFCFAASSTLACCLSVLRHVRRSRQRESELDRLCRQAMADLRRARAVPVRTYGQVRVRWDFTESASSLPVAFKEVYK